MSSAVQATVAVSVESLVINFSFFSLPILLYFLEGLWMLNTHNPTYGHWTHSLKVILSTSFLNSIDFVFKRNYIFRLYDSKVKNMILTFKPSI